MKRNHYGRRIAIIVLTLALTLSMIPMNIFAKTATPPQGKTLYSSDGEQVLIVPGEPATEEGYYRYILSDTKPAWEDWATATKTANDIKASTGGEYTIWYRLSTNENPHQIVGSVKTKILPIAPQGKNGLFYTGEAQQLVIAGTPAWGNGYYRYILSDTEPAWEDWATATKDAKDITATEPGNYKVWYRLWTTENPRQEVGSLDVNIAKAAVDPKGISGIVYDGTKKKLVIPGRSKEDDGYYRYIVSNEEPAWEDWATATKSADEITAIEPGEYTIWYRLWTEENPDQAIGTVKSTIIKKPVVASGLVYDGTNQNLIETAGIAGKADGYYRYIVSDEEPAWEDWEAATKDASDITGKDAGEYIIWYRLWTEENPKQKVESASVTISPIKATVTVDNKTKVKGEKDPELTASITGLADGDKLDVKLSRESGETVGAYKITATVTENTNYEVTIVDGKLTITAPVNVATGDNNNILFYALTSLLTLLGVTTALSFRRKDSK